MLCSEPGAAFAGGGTRLETLGIDLRPDAVGDVLLVRAGEEFPCDLILLSTDDVESGECYITTANVDGEANLKIRTALDITKALKPRQLVAPIGDKWKVALFHLSVLKMNYYVCCCVLPETRSSPFVCFYLFFGGEKFDF